MPQTNREPGTFDTPEQLYSAVEALDPEAAAYLRNHNHRQESTLCLVFSWAASPQGFMYWCKLHGGLCKAKPQRFYANGLLY